MPSDVTAKVEIALLEAVRAGGDPKKFWERLSEAAIAAVLEDMREPGEDARTAGLQAYVDNEEALRAAYNAAPENRGKSVPLMPTCSLLVRTEAESNAVWQAMLEEYSKEAGIE